MKKMKIIAFIFFIFNFLHSQLAFPNKTLIYSTQTV